MVVVYLEQLQRTHGEARRGKQLAQQKIEFLGYVVTNEVGRQT